MLIVYAIPQASSALIEQRGKRNGVLARARAIMSGAPLLEIPD